MITQIYYTGVAFKQKNLGAHKFFIEQGNYLIQNIFLKKESFIKMYKVLELNGILGLVSDQDAGKRGVFVNFLIIKHLHQKALRYFTSIQNLRLYFHLVFN